MTFHDVSLGDKFDLTKERVFLSGAQAVVRMLMMQRERDRLAGLDTAGFISGYRGSPLGGLDQQLWKAKQQLAGARVVFQPGLNEELAATACWGTQQTELLGEGKHDGVFAVWYGKGPGVDRSGDVFRHANFAGSSKHGGVLALMGDDHTAESSTNAHATEFLFVDTMIPILNPAGVQEVIDYGLYGFALSRFAGTWAAIKCVKDNIESTASVDAGLGRVKIAYPEFDMPPGGLNIRRELDQLGQEARLHEFKRAAAAAFIGVNPINKIVYSGGRNPKIGIITTGKNYLDVRQALDDLGINEERSNELGIRLFKIGCPWPLDREHLEPFAKGLDLIIVVEEKRSLIETQVRENLYGTANQPIVVGKKDERGAWLFPAKGALDPNDIAIAIGERVLKVVGPSEDIAARVNRLRQYQAMLADAKDVGTRTPYFCSGCPHNSSTKVPDGSIAAAGIGCHFMALWMDRDTHGFTQMGGEGAQWVGQAPFSTREHIFQNIGDGTYNHSGSLAIRFARGSGANVTYKILYNDAVAMTGGQPHDGNLTVDMIAHQVRAEGVERIAVVTDEPDKFKVAFPTGTTIHHRDDLDLVQRELREEKGVSILIYDQTCAAEKRRRRKRGTFPDPDKRVIINELVCEGCGDCGVQSNCVSIQPVETEFGRKRRIDQSSCNKDFSCVNGFCPSFVTVHGGKLRKASGVANAGDPLAGVPEPKGFALDGSGWACVIDGVGGTGVVTIGAILGMAAHLEGKGCGMIDRAGLAQKGGAVFSHVRIAPKPEDVSAIRVSAGKADLVLGCDLVVSGAKKVLASASEDRTLFICNTAEVMPGDFARSADFSLPVERLKKAIRAAVGEEQAHFFDASAASKFLFGNSIGANMFLLGIAVQMGGVPLAPGAIERAIELNGESVAMNLAAFRWGRRAGHDPAAVRDIVADGNAGAGSIFAAGSLDDVIQAREDFLAAYQDRAYARRYRERVDSIRAHEAVVSPGSTALADAVARNLFKLMAIKDEYEVARLYTDGSFQRQLGREFESYDRLEFHLAPPVLGKTGVDGKPRKSTFGPWMMRAFRVLSSLRRLRGGSFDLFGRTEERRAERQLLKSFEADLDLIGGQLQAGNLEAAIALASTPSLIRGFGHVRRESMRRAEGERARLIGRFNAEITPNRLAAAE